MKLVFIGIIAPASVLFPLLVGVVNYKWLSKECKVLIYYFSITLLANMINRVLAINYISNLFVFHAYTPIEALFLFQFFAFVFAGDKIVKAIRFLKILFPAYCILVFIFFQNSALLNSYTRSIEALLFIGLCMYYWWHSIRQETEFKWSDVPLNWIVSGLLLYFSSALFYFIFSNVLRFNYTNAINIFILNINAAMVIVMNILCAVGFYKFRK